LLETLIEPVTGWAAAQPGKPLEPAAVQDVLGRLEKFLGKPPQPRGPKPKAARGGPPAATLTTSGAVPSVVEERLKAAAERLTESLDQRLAELAVCLIEQPALRLAGAEEAIRQVTALIESALQSVEQLARELTQRAAQAYEGLQALLKDLQAAPAGRTAAPRRSGLAAWWGGADEGPAPQPAELLRSYAKGRSQGLLLERVASVYVSLRGQLSDQVREVGYCRNRLADLCKLWDGAAKDGKPAADRPGAPAAPGSGLPASLADSFGRSILPTGCATPEDAVRRLLEGVNAEELDQLDQRLQGQIREQFTALVHVCLNSVPLKTFAAALAQETEAFLAGKLAGLNVLDMFTAQAGDGTGGATRLAEEIAAGLHAAKPDLGSLVSSRFARSTEAVLLAAPAEPPASEGGPPRFRDLVRQALPNQKLVITDAQEGTAANEVLFYREELGLTLSDLKLLGPLGRESYRQMNSLEHFTPHTRIDITEWYPAVKQ
jgi:hypothetical protein